MDSSHQCVRVEVEHIVNIAIEWVQARAPVLHLNRFAHSTQQARRQAAHLPMHTLCADADLYPTASFFNHAATSVTTLLGGQLSHLEISFFIDMDHNQQTAGDTENEPRCCRQQD